MEETGIRLVGGVAAGRPTVQVLSGDEVLFSVSAGTEDEAFAEARKRLSAAAPQGGRKASGIAAIPTVSHWSVTSARKLLDALLASEGHPKSASAFALETRPSPEGETGAHWLEAGKKGTGGPGPRQRAYLACYWIISGSGQRFWGRGLAVGEKFLRPDKGVMRECLHGGLVGLEDGKFALTPEGERVVSIVLARAPWQKIAGEAPEATPLAEFYRGGNG